VVAEPGRDSFKRNAQVTGVRRTDLPDERGPSARRDSRLAGPCSQKWLTRSGVRDQVHDGEKMGGDSYRVPRYPVAPGAEVPKEDFVIIESMPVKSIITFPATATKVAGGSTQVRGHAWAGDRKVSALHVSIDFGST
jgi:hypothetical protein